MDIHCEIFQIPVVDADDFCARLYGAGHLVGVMCLDQCIEPEGIGQAEVVLQLPVTEQAAD